MRGTVAKKLRAMARENTIGNDDVMYDGYRHENGRFGRIGYAYQIKLQPGCTRHELKRLKKIFKQRH